MSSKTPYLICIVLIGLMPTADVCVLVPLMADLARMFPEAGLTKINLALTISSLWVIPASLMAGRLVSRGGLTKKGCLLMGYGLASVGGAAGGLWADLDFLLCTRSLLGIGNGLITAMVVTVTADYFTLRESGWVLGLFSAMGNVMGVGFSVASGYLTMMDWRYGFFLFLLGLPVMAYLAAVLKKTPDAPRPSADDAPTAPAPADAAAPAPPAGPLRLGRPVVMLVIVTLLCKAFSNSIFLTLSPFIEGEGLGDAAKTGLAGGVLTMAMVGSSLLFNRLYIRVGRGTEQVFFAVIGLGFLLLSQVQSFGQALAALVVFGLGAGLSLPYVLQEAIARPPVSLIAFTGALINSCLFISMTLSTFAQPLTIALSGDHGLRFYFAAAGLTSLASGGLMLLLNYLDVGRQALTGLAAKADPGSPPKGL